MKTNIKCPHCEKEMVLSVEKDARHEAVAANVIANVSKDSNIQEASWNKEDKVLVVLFSNGGTYAYKKVDENTFNSFAKTLKSEKESSGTHFYKFIRNNFECEKLK